MGICNNSLKLFYYKYIKKELKKSYEQNIKIELNKEIVKQWIRRNKKIISKKIIYINWKDFLLNQLNDQENNIEEWKLSLINFIQKEINNNQKYLLENEILLEQFCFSFFPKLFEINKDKPKPKKIIKISENLDENLIIEENKSEKLIKSNENLISSIERKNQPL